MSQQKYFFDHLAKTGGMSMISIFTSIFGRENVTPPTPGNVGSAESFLNMHEDYLFVVGHVDHKPGCKALFRRCLITCLRDPKDRALSSFFFRRNNLPPGLSYEVDVAKGLNIAEYFSDEQVVEEMSCFYINHFCAMMASHLPDSVGERLRLAKTALDAYDFVGIQERFRDTVDFMCLKFGWPVVEDIPVVNKTNQRQTADSLSPDIAAILDHVTRHDRELYLHALGIFERQRAELIRGAIRRARSQGATGTETGEDDGAAQSRLIVSSMDRDYREFGSLEIAIRAVTVNDVPGGENEIPSGARMTVSVYVESFISSEEVVVGFAIFDQFRRHMYGTNSILVGKAIHVSPGQIHKVTFAMPANLGSGQYEIACAVHEGPDHRTRCYHWKDLAARFQIVSPEPCTFEGAVRLEPDASCTSVWPFKPFDFTLRLAGKPPSVMDTDGTAKVRVTVTNRSGMVAKTTGVYPLSLSYHWLTPEGEVIAYDGKRTPLGGIEPGESQDIDVDILAHGTAGASRLRISMVLDGVAWLEDQGLAPIDIPVTLRAPRPSAGESRRSGRPAARR